MRRIRRHLSFANVASAIALFVAVSGGTAVALNGSNTVQSDDLGPGAQVTAADVVNESLTGADIKNKSGVDTCVNTVRLGNLCVRAENLARTWFDAIHHCANLGLRPPSLGEALEMAKTRDIPNVDQTELFWTGTSWQTSEGARAYVVDDTGFIVPSNQASARETVCVTTPTN